MGLRTLLLNPLPPSISARPEGRSAGGVPAGPGPGNAEPARAGTLPGPPCTLRQAAAAAGVPAGPAAAPRPGALLHRHHRQHAHGEDPV